MRWITATDLDSWADRAESRGQFPALLRRLVYATATGLESVDFPSGDSISRPGFDGETRCSISSEFVPAGSTAWECSSEKEPAGKAQRDYGKRAPNLQKSFVFATPRRWQGKNAWAAERGQEDCWADVRAYDADDLERWLERAPAVAAWLARFVLERVPPGALAMEDWWRDWSGGGNRQLPPALLTLGREKQVGKVREWLTEEPSRLNVEAETGEEGLAFLAACADQLEGIERDRFWSRALVIDCAGELATFGALPRSLIIGIVGANFVGRAELVAGQYVFASLGRNSYAGVCDLALPVPRRLDMQRALADAGWSGEEAGRISADAGGSILALRRLTATGPLALPSWADPIRGRALLPALLAGSWDSYRPGDTDVLAALAGTAYAEYEAELTILARVPDAPVRCAGTVWRIAGRPDAFLLLARYLTAADLSRFRKAIEDVFSSPDPRRQLEPGQRWLAVVYGKQRPHSDHLRRGLAEGLALIAVRGPATCLGAQIAGLSRIVVRQLLAGASAERWSDVADILPALAEAAPAQFLRAVETSLADAARPVMALFMVREGPTGEESDHAGLLWALESLAWEPERLAAVSLILGRLDELDPGGKSGNRPGGSLRDIFLLWRPQTAATMEQRQQVIGLLCARAPDAGWRLLLALLPAAHQWLVPSCKPRWRELPPEPEPNEAEIAAGIEWVGARLLEGAGRNGRRWAELIASFRNLPRSQWRPALDQLRATIPEIVEGRAEVWARLQKLIHEHRRYREADWVLPAAEVDELEELGQELALTGVIDRLCSLFDWHPPIPRPEADYHENERLEELAQDGAVGDIHRQLGTAGLLDLARAAPQPQFVGFAMNRTFGDAMALTDFIDVAVATDEPKPRIAGRALVASRFGQFGWNWVDQMLARAEEAGWASAHTTEFLLALPNGPVAWERVASLGHEIETGYWAQAQVCGLPDGPSRAFAARRLLAAGRVLPAFELASLHPEDQSIETLTDILRRFPKALVESGPGSARRDVAWELERIFSDLDARDFDREETARLELNYLSALRFAGRAFAVHGLLAENPVFFAELVELAYSRAQSEGEVTPGGAEDHQARAEAAYGILRSWNGMPGRRGDGALDGPLLSGWVAEARRAFAANGREKIGDEQIGEMLARGFTGLHDDRSDSDVAVRQIIEEAQSESLDNGIAIGLERRRGVFSRLPGDGGEPELQKAGLYRNAASRSAYQWPRTSRILTGLAESYEAQAERMAAMDEQMGIV